MGAGGNVIFKVIIIGIFTITQTGSNLVVIYIITAGYSLSVTHFYYDIKYPSLIAPGQFGNTHDSLPQGSTQNLFSIPYNPVKMTYIVHAAIGYTCEKLSST
jgi:hypothetical protein